MEGFFWEGRWLYVVVTESYGFTARPIFRCGFAKIWVTLKWEKCKGLVVIKDIEKATEVVCYTNYFRKNKNKKN